MKKYRVGIFLFNDVEVLDFAGPFEVFSVTSELNNYELCEVFTVTEDGKEINAVNGLRVVPDYSFESAPQTDILIIPGGDGTKKGYLNNTVLNWVSKQNESSDITISVCSGARILAKLGLLDDIPSITHHEVIPSVQQIAPKTEILADERFVDTGKIMTAGGISAGIDLSLHIVGKLFGKAIADKTKVYMEYGSWRELLP